MTQLIKIFQKFTLAFVVQVKMFVNEIFFAEVYKNLLDLFQRWIDFQRETSVLSKSGNIFQIILNHCYFDPSSFKSKVIRYLLSFNSFPYALGSFMLLCKIFRKTKISYPLIRTRTFFGNFTNVLNEWSLSYMLIILSSDFACSLMTCTDCSALSGVNPKEKNVPVSLLIE